jgi:hypothetical protein
MKKIDIKKMGRMEYWVGNSFIEDLSCEIIFQIESNYRLLEEIKKNGSKIELSREQKKAYIAGNLDDCFEYIQNSINNGHEIDLDVDQIIGFAVESIAEAIEEFIENDYKNEWEQVKVFYLKNQIGILEENETLEGFLRKDFKEISKAIEMGDCNEYPVWFNWYENILVDLEKKPQNYIKLDSEWYAYKKDFDVRK